MKHIADIQPGGFIVDNEYHLSIGEMINQRDATILAIAGDKAIISGVELDGGNHTAGVVTYNGKIYSFIAGATQTQVTTKKIALDRPNANQVDAPAFYEDVIEFGSDGLETFDFAELTRVKNLQEIITDASLVNVVPAWTAITGKPAFLSQKLYGKVTVGDVADSGNTSVSVSGDITSAQVLAVTNDDHRIKINFASVGTSSYVPNVVLVSLDSDFDADNDVIYTVKNILSSSFEILLREVSSNVQNLQIAIQIIV